MTHSENVNVASQAVLFLSLSRTSHQQLTASTWSSDKGRRTEREKKKRQPWIWRTSIFRLTAAATIVVLTRTRLLRVQTVKMKTVKVCCYLLHPFQTHFMAVTASLAPQQSSAGCDCWPGLCDVTLAVQSSFHTHTSLPSGTGTFGRKRDRDVLVSF